MIDENHVYSYSQLSSFSECPFSYYLSHIEKPRPEEAPNAWAEQGTLIHDLLDKWAKGALKKEELADEYVRRYGDEVVTSFPRMMKGYAEKSYQQGLDYFLSFDGFPGYDIVAAEEEYKMPLKLTNGTTRPFVAYIDLVLRDQETGGLVVLDHKSKSKATFKKERETMYKQQYLYSYFVHEKYGEWPERLQFNLFKEQLMDERNFSEKEFAQTMNWATESILKIEDMDFLEWLECKPLTKSGKPDMFCSSICQWRNICPNAR